MGLVPKKELAGIYVFVCTFSFGIVVVVVVVDVKFNAPIICKYALLQINCVRSFHKRRPGLGKALGSKNVNFCVCRHFRCLHNLRKGGLKIQISFGTSFMRAFYMHKKLAKQRL